LKQGVDDHELGVRQASNRSTFVPIVGNFSVQSCWDLCRLETGRRGFWLLAKRAL